MRTILTFASLENVDPYCEREFLLVALDLMLLRPEAYRHVLFNHDAFRHLLVDDSSLSYLLIIGRSILEAYLVVNDERAQSLAFLQAVFSSIVNTIFLLGSTWILLLVLLSAKISSNTIARTNDLLQRRLSMALLLPTVFHVVTACVLLWEDSSTVRRLGSCLVVLYQGMAVHAVGAAAIVSPEDQSNSREEKRSPVISLVQQYSPVLALALALHVRAVMLVLLRRATLVAPVPCLGLEWTVGRNNDLCLF